MKMKLLYCFLLLLTGNLINGQVPDSLKVISLRPDEFEQEFKRESNPLLVDVREFFEFKKSRIKNAVNIPSSGNLEFSADTIKKDRPLFFYCTSGFRSKRVAKYFCEKGFIKVYSLDGGIAAWRKEGLPVEKKKLRR